MKVPLSWLSEFIDLPTSDPVTLAGVLGSLGHEVEGWETISPTFSGVVVEASRDGEPTPRRRPGPAHRWTSSGDLLEVVCGAWNFEAGAVVAFAPVGAQLNPEGKPMEIEGSSGRGVVSRDDLLRLRARVGRRPHRDPRPRPAGGGRTRRRGSGRAEAVLPLSDVILDVTITPNRPDVMSILGIARELGAYYELPVRQPDTRVDDTGPETAAAVEVEDPLGCPRFVAPSVRHLVGPSPLPAQLRLRAAGVRPISNVVGAATT